MDNKFARIFVIGSCGLHLHGVVAIAKLCKAEAADRLKAIDLIEKVVVASIVKSQTRTTEEVQLDSVLDALSGVNKADELMRAVNVVRIRIELSDRHQAFGEDLADLPHRVVPLVFQISVVIHGREDRITQGAEPVVAFLGGDIEKLEAEGVCVHNS